MISTLTLIVALTAGNATPGYHRARCCRQATCGPAYHQTGEMVYSYGDEPSFRCTDDGEERLGSCECGGCDLPRGLLAGCFRRMHGACNMVERAWYFPEAHGYYYFRPYNYTHVAQHQALASQWGIDPRNPYSNEMFDNIYREVESRIAPEFVPREMIPSAQFPAMRVPTDQNVQLPHARSRMTLIIPATQRTVTGE